MMHIGKSRVDHRGRITLPKSFRQANGITERVEVIFEGIYNNDESIKLSFKAARDPITGKRYNMEDDHV